MHKNYSSNNIEQKLPSTPSKQAKMRDSTILQHYLNQGLQTIPSDITASRRNFEDHFPNAGHSIHTGCHAGVKRMKRSLTRWPRI